VKGLPWPWDATWDLGAWLSLYWASYAGSTPNGTTPGPMIGLWLTRVGIILSPRAEISKPVPSTVAVAWISPPFDRKPNVNGKTEALSAAQGFMKNQC